MLRQFSFPEEPHQRSFFENFIPKLVNLLELDYQADYSKIMIVLLEKLAENNKINRFEIYHFEKLLNLVKKNYHKKDESLRKKLPAFIKTSKFLPKQLKEDLLLDIAEKIFLK